MPGPLLNRYERERAVRYNRGQSYPRATRERIQREVGAEPDGVLGPKTALAIARWQHAHGLEADGYVGPKTQAALGELWREERVLTRDGILELAWPSIHHESGGDAGAANRDGEWMGYFDEPRRHPVTRAKLTPVERARLRAELHAKGELAEYGYEAHWASRYADDGSRRAGVHIGLSLGEHQMTQDGGALGSWIRTFWRLHPRVVEGILGPRAPEIVAMLNQPGREREVVVGQGPGRRSPRTRKVQTEDGAWKDLWEQPWLTRMQRLARHELADEVTEENLLTLYAYKTLGLAFEHGFTSEGELAVALDIAIQYGGGGARRRMRDVVEDHGELTLGDLLRELPPERRPRRRTVYNRSEWWVIYTHHDIEEMR